MAVSRSLQKSGMDNSSKDTSSIHLAWKMNYVPYMSFSIMLFYWSEFWIDYETKKKDLNRFVTRLSCVVSSYMSISIMLLCCFEFTGDAPQMRWFHFCPTSQPHDGRCSRISPIHGGCGRDSAWCKLPIHFTSMAKTSPWRAWPTACNIRASWIRRSCWHKGYTYSTRRHVAQVLLLWTHRSFCTP